MTALQSGSGPDIIEVQHGWVQGYAQSDLVLPLDDTIQDKDDYNKAVIAEDTYNGQLYAIPYRIECTALIYNMDDYTKAGLDPANPPQTWDDWMAASKKMTTDGVYGMAITGGGEFGNTITRALPLVWMNGGDIISADGKKAVINSPEVAIVGVNKIMMRPVWDGNAFIPRKMMNLSSSFDHRVVDGWDAALFVQRLKTLLETPALIFVEG